MIYAKLTEKTYDLADFLGGDCDMCKIVKTKYTNNHNTALGILNNHGELEVLLTANLDFKLPEKIVLLKDYNENKGVVKELVDAKIVKLTGNTYPSGFIELVEAEILDLEDFKINFEGELWKI